MIIKTACRIIARWHYVHRNIRYTFHDTFHDIMRIVTFGTRFMTRSMTLCSLWHSVHVPWHGTSSKYNHTFHFSCLNVCHKRVIFCLSCVFDFLLPNAYRPVWVYPFCFFICYNPVVGNQHNLNKWLCFQVISDSALRDAKKMVLNAFDENKDGRIDIAEVLTVFSLSQLIQ